MTAQPMQIEVVPLPDPDTDRYASPRLLAWWSQEKLAAARVMVVGAGALGNEVLKNLALVGIGRIFVVDFDRVELSNLSRSVLYRAEDRGRLKAEVAAERVRELNPDVDIVACTANVVTGLGLGLFRRMDLVIGCLDNLEARWAVNRACWRFGVPWVDGGMEALSGQIKVFLPPKGACFECGLTETDRRNMTLRRSCPWLRDEDIVLRRVPTTASAASIIGGIQAQEALKALTGLELEAGSAFYYDGTATRGRRATLARREDCMAHETWSPVTEIPLSAAATTVREAVAAAAQLLGEGAVVSLDREILVHHVCSGCGAKTPAMAAYDGRPPGPCAKCGEALYPELTHELREGLPHPERTLAELGVPPLQTLLARKSDRTAYFELSADAAAVLTWRQRG
jgi:molybdopterin/thiamine biosynthesis adenylyltransferase